MTAEREGEEQAEATVASGRTHEPSDKFKIAIFSITLWALGFSASEPVLVSTPR